MLVVFYYKICDLGIYVRNMLSLITNTMRLTPTHISVIRSEYNFNLVQNENLNNFDRGNKK